MCNFLRESFSKNDTDRPVTQNVTVQRLINVERGVQLLKLLPEANVFVVQNNKKGELGWVDLDPKNEYESNLIANYDLPANVSIFW